MFADRFAARLRYVRERKAWLAWGEGRWRVDVTGEAERAAKEIARERLRLAADLEGKERDRAAAWALHSQSDARLQAMLRQASSELPLVLRAEQLDADPMLLSCANGVIDLQTCSLRPHDPADLVSLGTEISYDPAATCPRWERFLVEVFAGDMELIAWLQRLVGYCLTGDVREHVVAVLHGTGGNGKDTFIKPLVRVLGDHALASPFATFMRTRDEGRPRNDLARLHRARLVVASESSEDRRLDEAVVKLVSGGGRVPARFLFGEFFEYAPRFKVWLVTNHRPRIDGNDDAIWRRLREIPFEVSFIGREDRTLDDKLADELPGILTWAVTGCCQWQARGLGTCGAVERATREYRLDEDVLGAFIADRCELAGEVEPHVLRAAYEAYSRDRGERPLTASHLGRRLKERGITRAKPAGALVYRGISLRS